MNIVITLSKLGKFKELFQNWVDERIKSAIAAQQFKTINDVSIKGSGNIEIEQPEELVVTCASGLALNTFTLACTGADYILYDVNGSGQAKYTSAITIAANSIIKAVGVKNNKCSRYYAFSVTYRPMATEEAGETGTLTPNN